MAGVMIALDKQHGVCLVGVVETWILLFSIIVIKFKGLEDTSACQYYQLCVVLKAVIDVSYAL